MQQLSEKFLELVRIMDELREKCPWDKKQTIHTLRSMTIEETYELADAVTAENWPHIKEELGDLLLHIIFYSKIGTEQQQFNLQEVIETISEKLIVRHPHIYGDVKVASDEEVKRNWEKIKMKQGKESVLSGVPASLPSVVKASRIQEKAKQVGFEWNDKADVWKKVEEEMAELKEAEDISIERTEEEFGDLLFSLVNYARFLHIDAETALEKTNKKFIRRFQLMEAMAKEKGRTLDTMTLQEMDDLWNDIKSKKNNS